MTDKLYSFEYIVKQLAEKYNVPFEIVESILIDWTRILYENLRPTLDSSLFSEEL